MKAYGAAGAAITARDGIDIPTQPARRPAHWPALPDRTAWTSPIGPPTDPAATQAAERAAARTVASEAAKPAARRRQASDRTPCTPRRGTGRSTTTAAAPTVATRKTTPTKKAATATATRAGQPGAARPAAATAGVVRPVGADRADLLARLRVRWDAGMPQTRIAAELGVSVSQVQRLRRTAGLSRRNQRLHGEEIVRLYVEERLSLDAIAARLGTSSGAVRYRLDAAGVTRRRPGQEHALPAAVRAEALARIASGQRPVDVRRTLGIGETTLLRWRRTAATAGTAAACTATSRSGGAR